MNVAATFSDEFRLWRGGFCDAQPDLRPAAGGQGDTITGAMNRTASFGGFRRFKVGGGAGGSGD